MYYRYMRISNKIKGYLDLAKRVAQQSQHDHFKHGAVLVKGGSVLNTSCNKDKYKSFGNRFRDTKTCGHATHHAELGCILGLDKSITQGATMYVVRVNRQGEYRLSKPCPMCEEVLKFCGVKKVVYTTDEASANKIKL
tara:strand:- start:279 stop:692 length:414 start_codon:yes stop_codon:yes gene_type:complete